MTTATSLPAAPPPHSLPDQAYVRMALVLRVGLGVSLAILGGGIVAYIAMNPGTSSSAVLSGNPILSYLNPAGLWSGLTSGSVGAYLTLGLIVLVATPVLRVVSGLYYFFRGKEWAMSAIASTVLVLLLLGLLVIGPRVR